MEVNFLAVALAALSAFFLGFFWYNIFFTKIWQREIGAGEKAKDMMPPNLGVLLAGSLVLEVIMAYVLATFIGVTADAGTGLVKGLMVGLGLVGFAFGVNYLFEGKSRMLWLINAGYNTVVFGVMGLIIGIL